MTTPAQFGPDLVAQLADIARTYPVDVPTVLRLASEVEEVIRADERAKVAEEIRSHAERHAPAGHPLNHPRTVLRRHLLLAARIAEGPLTDDDLAHIAAQVVGLARQHTTGEDTDPR